MFTSKMTSMHHPQWKGFCLRRSTTCGFHDETLRGLTGSIFKECGAVNPAFLSYLNFDPLENHRSDCKKCYNPLLWLSTKLFLLIVSTSITTANFNLCFLVLVYNSVYMTKSKRYWNKSSVLFSLSEM